MDKLRGRYHPFFHKKAKGVSAGSVENLSPNDEQHNSDVAAVALVLMRLEHQAGEELMLRKLLKRKAMWVRLKRASGRLVGDEQHRPW